jgi:hypothetical protein
MMRKVFAIGVVALTCALPASASAKAHPRLKTHRLVSHVLKEHPRLK